MPGVGGGIEKVQRSNTAALGGSRSDTRVTKSLDVELDHQTLVLECRLH